MIITRTPFRVTLGGGGTDLPSYYSQHGGFIFSFTLDKYMYINLKRAFTDDLIRIKYNKSETVARLSDIEHDIARECLQKGLKSLLWLISQLEADWAVQAPIL